jgi:hypothetical protein
MPLVVYDLLGALFAPPAPLGSRHNDKLFMRACHIVKNRFADPDISPREVAAEAGISLRYCRSCSRSVARHAVTTYVRPVWIMRRV